MAFKHKIKDYPSFKIIDKIATFSLASWIFIPLTILSFIYIDQQHGNGNNIQAIISAASFTIISLVVACLTTFYTTSALKELKHKKNKQKILGAIFTPLFGYFWLKRIATSEMHALNTVMEKKPGFIHFKRTPANPIVISLIILTLFIVVTWFINVIHGPIKYPAIDDEGNPYTATGSIPGIFDIIKAPLIGFVGNSTLIIYLLSVSFFAVVIEKTKIFNKFFTAIFKKNKNKEIIILPFVILLFMVLGSVNHMSDELMTLYPLVASIMIAAGFDLITALFAIYLSTTTGIVCATIDPFAIIIGFTSAGGNMSDGIIWRFISLAIVYSIVCTYVVLYAKRVKANPTRSIVYSDYQNAKSTFKFDSSISKLDTKDKLALTTFVMTFVILLVGIIRWDTLTGFNGFIEFQNWLATYIPYITSNIGDTRQVAIGTWSLETLPALFVLSGIIMSLIFKFTFEDIIGTFAESIRGCARIIMIFSIIGGFQEIVIASGLSHTLSGGVNAIAETNETLAIVLLFLFFFLFAFVMPSCSGGARMLFPIIGDPLSLHGILPNAISAYAAGAGLNCMLMPTNGSFLTATSILGIPLGKAYRAFLPIFGIIALTMLGLLVAGTFIPFAGQQYIPKPTL